MKIKRSMPIRVSGTMKIATVVTHPPLLVASLLSVPDHEALHLLLPLCLKMTTEIMPVLGHIPGIKSLVHNQNPQSVTGLHKIR